MAENKKDQVAEVLVRVFKIPLEQAKDLVMAYRLSGSYDEGIMATAQALDISLEIVQKVFYSLDDLAALVKEDQDLKKWWQTGEM